MRFGSQTAKGVVADTSGKQTGEALPTNPEHRMDGEHGDGGLAQ
jgi:hypothetical protein